MTQSDPAPHEGMSCPTCRVRLVMTERTGIEIDYCPRCRGVWLDRGELDKIVERSSDLVRRQPTMLPDATGESRSGHGGHGGHGSGRRGGSWLSELFD